jgi:predicted nucleic acid-binding protein
MLWGVDTNILCALMQPALPQYAECVRATNTLRLSGEPMILLSQVSVEFWFFLTRPPIGHRPGLGLTPAQADVEMRRLEGLFPTWPDVPVIHAEWRQIVVTYGVSGVQVYDARLAAAAHMHGITHLLTYNGADFARYTAFLTAVHPRTL